MLIGFRKKGNLKCITYILLINFINLTANFYQVSSLDDTLLKHEDPYGSLSELALEYLLEMEAETIPDTEMPEEKRKMPDVKTCVNLTFFQILQQFFSQKIKENCFSPDMYKNIILRSS